MPFRTSRPICTLLSATVHLLCACSHKGLNRLQAMVTR